MNEVGHNNPPDMTETAISTSGDLSAWMAFNPVIETEDQAREAKVFIDRAYLCVKDLEDERKGINKPFEEKIKGNNHHYRAPRELLEGVAHELKSRFDAFLLREESKRQAAAAEAARLAEEAERVAREAERKEREAADEAASGVIGHDISAVTADANQAFADYQKASRNAAIAERETKVKIGGGFRRALSLREKEILYVYNAEAAIATLGPTDDIVAAILKSARAYRKLNGKLPAGVSADIERKS